ncbi:MAG: hypothetical protein DCO96_11600 [Fluviicola sp. XM-24bin1]|nr:MAG: hypothetical protein DCO96_11600 [Fluviicola sp. XM-24bin1]
MTPKESYLEIGTNMAEKHGSSLGKMFGKESLVYQTKAFPAFHNERMIFRLGAEEITLVKGKYEGSENWDPSGKGRPMKDWLAVPHEYNSDWASLAEQALERLKKML